VADGVPSRPSVPPDLVHLLELMHMRSEVVEMRLARGPDAPPAIEEIAPASPSVLDRLVEARVREEERALSPGSTEPEAEVGIEEAADLPAIEEASGDQGAAAASFGELAPEELGIEEAEAAAAEDDDLTLLELNAFEAGQPPADGQMYEAPVAPEAGPEPEPERIVEEDQLIEAAVRDPDTSADHAASFEPDQMAELEPAGEPALDPHADLAAIQADLSRMEEDLAHYEQLTSQEAAAEEPASAAGEGPGEDFQALLAGARAPQPEGQAETSRDGEDVALLPADGDVRLRARNGPRPGAEFTGKSTLAGVTGMFCLIHGFNLPLGTRMKVSLIPPDAADQLQIDDALVSRLRKAPDNATEVQLTFESRHAELPDFVGQHFGKPSFSLFGRRRPKR